MSEQNYKVVSTKVNNQAHLAFTLICESMGMKPYEFLQMVIDTIIRTLDKKHSMSPELRKVIDLFQGMEGWKGAMNHAMTTDDADIEVGEATYYMNDGRGTKHGTRAILVSKPFFGQAQYTMNENTIIERAMCLMFPSLYKRLRYHAAETGCSNVVQLLEKWEQTNRNELDTDELNRIFSDNERSEFGNVAASEPYKRKMHKTIEED